LKKEIERLKKSVKKQRYGLVWMDVPEAFEDDVENKLPILKEVPELAIKNNDGKPTHILIEGDNYHALTCLSYTHKGKIDVVYIDPPYNTGSDGFRYKDKRILDKFPDGTEVPKDNPFRHSYWLSFMQKRLDLVRDLLSKNGVVFISIDDNEMAQLKLLCDSIFGDDNVEVMIWHKVADDSGKLKITYRFRREHEYIIVCYKQKDETYFKKYLSDRNYKNEYTNPDNDPRGPYKQGIISTTEEKSKSTGKNFYSIKTPSGKIITRQWRFTKEEFESLDKDNRIYYGKSGSSIPSEKVFINEQKETTPTSILTELGTAKSAGIDLEELMGSKIFSYPKPVTLIKHLIKISSEKIV
ncbi:MAG: site-specific DNA-methyltransferase, partial [Candidatus Levybacteria bacterium]|nr:site-specific DNA-methyltransferase [Candidatus Levybacteria bacterium]